MLKIEIISFYCNKLLPNRKYFLIGKVKKKQKTEDFLAESLVGHLNLSNFIHSF